MCIYLYKATIYSDDARCDVAYQGMTIAETYTDALTNIQNYYTSRDEYLTTIYLEEQAGCECNCFDLSDTLYDYIHRHGELPAHD